MVLKLVYTFTYIINKKLLVHLATSKLKMKVGTLQMLVS
jgi:hypothetical protein